jgi:hypothetical protein
VFRWIPHSSSPAEHKFQSRSVFLCFHGPTERGWVGRERNGDPLSVGTDKQSPCTLTHLHTPAHTMHTNTPTHTCTHHAH